LSWEAAEMARKGLLSGMFDEKDEFTAVNSEAENLVSSKPPRSGGGAFGMMSRAANEMATKVEAAQKIEQQLLAGETVVDLDPDSIDASFVQDRIDFDEDRFQELVSAIQSRGQDTPILVRPNPNVAGRFQVVFGHRRVRAARLLGLPVRAVVRELSDEDHVVAQGQENSARADLSFIEQALFAASLLERGFDTSIVETALTVNKSVISKMHSVTRLIPKDVIKLFGSARGIGRDRWYELSLKFRDSSSAVETTKLLAQPSFCQASPDEKFDLLARRLSSFETPERSGNLSKTPIRTAYSRDPSDWSKFVKVKETTRARTLSFDKSAAPGFAEFVEMRLEALFVEFQEKTGD
jgi:ParB family transcriptional regulator, chromosome partitioning protein